MALTLSCREELGRGDLGAIPWGQNDWHERVEPEEVGPSAVYLALQDAASLTGQLVARAEFGKTWGI